MIFHDEKNTLIKFQKQPFAGAIQFAILTRKHTIWNYFSIKLQACFPEILLKRDSNTDALLECCEIVKNTYFQEDLRTAASLLLIIKFKY